MHLPSLMTACAHVSRKSAIWEAMVVFFRLWANVLADAQRGLLKVVGCVAAAHESAPIRHPS